MGIGGRVFPFPVDAAACSRQENEATERMEAVYQSKQVLYALKQLHAKSGSSQSMLRYFSDSHTSSIQGDFSLPVPDDRGTGVKHLSSVIRIAGRKRPISPLDANTLRCRPRIQNVILLEVEGLSRDVFDLDVDGKPVMPFLRRLSREGLYFPNTFQSFNATAGSVFSATTSFHKCCFEETTDRFADYEANCCYGSLSRVLGNADYTHYFCEGFRQCATDFTAFMANQGYSTYNYHDFERRLKAKNLLDETDNALGVFDGYFFQECAEIIRACPTKFTLHLMTATSHSPWTVPRSFSQRFTSPSANAFAYVDSSIELLFETLKKNLPIFDQTLFVIVADHTSITTNDNLINRIRVPLIFYNAKFAGKVERWENIQSSYASHVDILPTVLGFLGGDHDYSGMGRNLLTANESPRGVISGNNYTGLYLKDNFCLQYNQSDRETKLLLIDHDQISLNDVSIEYPEVFSQMQQEYWAQYELAKRLAAEKRVYPPKKGD